MNKALYPGTFDPVTNGHLWVVAKSIALDLFDEIVVAVARNPAKSPLFDLDERVSMWQQCAAMINERRIKVITSSDEFSVRLAKREGCRFLLRGIRTVQDYHDELTLQKVNHGLEPTIQAVYLMPDPDVADISGSLVRSMIGFKGWKEDVKKYVPVPVWEMLVGKFGQKSPWPDA